MHEYKKTHFLVVASRSNLCASYKVFHCSVKAFSHCVSMPASLQTHKCHAYKAAQCERLIMRLTCSHIYVVNHVIHRFID